MKIVIDIPESSYRLLQKQARTKIGRENLDEWSEAVLNGTPLPKGHGRLIDADAIKPIKAPIAPLTPEDTVHYEWVYMKRWIDQTPTIIEADKEWEAE